MDNAQSTEITTPVETHVAPMPENEGAAIIEMIARAASDPNVDIDKMERLMAMKERAVEREARMAFSSALAEMQPKLPVIPKLGKGQGGTKYGQWEDIQSKIMPVISKYGFALSFKTDVDGSTVKVTAILSHKDGHSEQTMLPLPADIGGQKNAVQAVGSSISYGKRYTACAMLNINIGGEDDDGQSAGDGEIIGQEQFDTIADLIVQSGADIELFCRHMGINSISDMSVKKYDMAVSSLKNKIAVNAAKGGQS